MPIESLTIDAIIPFSDVLRDTELILGLELLFHLLTEQQIQCDHSPLTMGAEDMCKLGRVDQFPWSHELLAGAFALLYTVGGQRDISVACTLPCDSPFCLSCK